jgi:ectoine hydroxylase-related dioxygenase (phytanoyl-CoA dioxygenase family)
VRAVKEAFLEGCEYRSGLLRKGDVAVFDARTMHCGGENCSGPTGGQRRVLFYFTLQVRDVPLRSARY